MKILFVHNGADLYGASRCLLQLSSRLVRNGHTVLVVLPYEGPLFQELSAHGVQVTIQHDLAIVSRQKYSGLRSIAFLFLNMFTSVFRLWSLIRSFHPDLIHTNSSVILSSGLVSRLTNTPHVWHVRESFGEFPELWKLYQWYMDRFADSIICVSTPIAEQFTPQIQVDKVHIIHDGFPKEEFEPVNESRVYLFRKNYSLDGCLAVGTVGRIKLGRKGQDVFVNAAALLKKKFPEVKFLCIGSPFPGNEEHLDKLKDLIHQLDIENRVVYTGDVDDIKAAQQALDICVLAAVQPEPFAGVVIEAMAMGKPVVGTRIGGTIEQIEDGITGYLVEPGNPESMALALEQLLADPQLRQRMGENGKKRFLERFEFEAFYQQILNEYSILIPQTI